MTEPIWFLKSSCNNFQNETKNNNFFFPGIKIKTKYICRDKINILAKKLFKCVQAFYILGLSLTKYYSSFLPTLVRFIFHPLHIEQWPIPLSFLFQKLSFVYSSQHYSTTFLLYLIPTLLSIIPSSNGKCLLTIFSVFNLLSFDMFNVFPINIRVFFFNLVRSELNMISVPFSFNSKPLFPYL